MKRACASGSLFEVINVDLDVLVPLSRHVVLREDRLHRTLVYAQTAIDTGIGVDVELDCGTMVARFFCRMDAVDGANFDAGGVLGSDARFSDDVCHEANSL
jgi:hypothetical protein